MRSANCRQPNLILNSDLTTKTHFVIFPHEFATAAFLRLQYHLATNTTKIFGLLARTTVVAHQHTWQLLFCNITTRGGGSLSEAEVFRQGSATYYQATIYRGHMSTSINNRHFIAVTN
jgi:hypothetical protein